MFCDNCGTQLREDAKFCHVCGAEQLPETGGGTPASSPASVIHLPATMKTVEQTKPAAEREPPPADSSVQPLSGTFSWENVKISGEFKDGVGTLTITFS